MRVWTSGLHWNPRTYKLEGGESGCWACLSYIVSSGPSWTITDHVSRKKCKKKKMLWEGWAEPSDSTMVAVGLDNYLEFLLWEDRDWRDKNLVMDIIHQYGRVQIFILKFGGGLFFFFLLLLKSQNILSHFFVLSASGSARYTSTMPKNCVGRHDKAKY